MAAHSTVTYVEPNMIRHSWKHEDNFERAPRLEDYCIAMNIEVEISSRDSQGSIKDGDKDVIILQWNNGKSDTVSFMGGTKMGGYEYNGLDRKERIKHTDPNLTTYYADMYVGDLVHYGTTEMLGIKSVNIEYAKSCVPIITVQFTDVRGLSLFQPTELSRDNTYNGIKGLNKDNVAQSFFQCFFKMPLPKFTIYLKGFYGNPVAYVCMCDKFNTNFNSDTGDFDATARFIGYTYSFMTDVSFDALLAAPYSDFFGKQYWEDNKKNGRFVLPDKYKTHNMPMPTLYEVHSDFKKLIESSDKEMEHTTLTEEEKTHKEEIAALEAIRGQFQLWYQKLFIVLKEKYGKRYVFDFKDDVGNEADWYRMLILTNSATQNKRDLSEEYAQYSDDFKKQTNELYSAIETFNKSGYSYKKLKNVSKDFSEYTRIKLFNDCYIKRETKKVEFGGFAQECTLNKVQVTNRLFYNSMTSNNVKENPTYRDYTLSTIYNDGIDQYKDAFVIEVDYSEIKRRILALQAHANKSEDAKEKEKARKEHNRIMMSKMNWYPSIENFTKIMMAHLETFMMMMYNVAEACSDRKPKDLGITIGREGEACDVNPNSGVVPPFPRVVKSEIGEDGITKTVDTWVGEYDNGKGFIEADMINGLFNAVEYIQQLVKDEIEAEQQQTIEPIQQQAPTVKHPLTPYDFFLSKKIYGTETDVANNANAFAGKVAMRMFDILSISNFRKQYPNKIAKANGDFIKKLGTIEAENFYDNVKITNSNMLGMLGVEGDKGTIDPNAILQCVKFNKGIGDNTEIPWRESNSDDSLFDSQLWLSRYTTSYSPTQKTYIYPMQNMSFSNLDETLKIFNKGANSVQANNNNIMVNWVEGDGIVKSLLEAKNGSCFGSIYIADDFKIVGRGLDEANSSPDNIYKDVYDMLLEDSTFHTDTFAEMIYPNGVFRPKQNIITQDKSCKFKIGSNVDSLSVHKDTNTNKMQCADGERVAYSFDKEKLPSYATEAENGYITSWFLTECRGFDNLSGTYVISRDRSMIYQDGYQKMIDSATGWTYGSAADRRMGFFLMGLEAIDYTSVAKHLDSNESFTYLPKLAVLQIGAALTSMKSIKEKVTLTSLGEGIFVPNTFSKIINYLNKINYTTRIGYIKYFKFWVFNNNANITKNVMGTAAQIACQYDIGNLKRGLFREDSEVICSLSNNLMSAVLVAKGNVNHYFGVTKNGLDIDDTVATSYLDGFLNRLRELYGVKEETSGGDAVKLVKSSDKTTDDMKKELYRYLKLVYDKWVPATKKESWKFETFFNVDEERKIKDNSCDGHLFHFIDSFYNKIGDKLLINPRLLSEKIDAALQANDVNTMMLGFMADIYSQNKCMMMCLQNFLDFGAENGSMEVMFTPIPYNEMPQPHKHPDFVIVYPYEPSKYLNIDNGEFNNDAFMLNDEFDTPLAVRSRGSNEDGYYRIPAFGVSYGKQYQSYFKKVNVNMDSPIATQQVIQAKHAILRASQDTATKTTVAQDMYDIYATQSYTCKVEMMGCAWIQPLMYFVLTNVPMFRGSYLIFKVNHKITPGNMITEFQGTRMANVSNKLVEEIFTDEDYEEETQPYLGTQKLPEPEPDNDCPYKVYPLYEDDDAELTKDESVNAKNAMKILMGKYGYTKAAAAGICGNIYKESTWRLHVKNGIGAFGLCQWLGDRKALLIKKYGDKPSFEQQLEYIDYEWHNESVAKNHFNELTAATSPENAAYIVRKYFERPGKAEADDTTRKKKAREYYNAYTTPTPKSEDKTSQPKKKVEDDIYKKLFDAVQKSINSTSKACELKMEMYIKKSEFSDGLMMIKQADGKYDKLPMVFDILLNSYYNYIQKLWWVSPSNDFKNNPIHIDVIATQKPKVENRLVLGMVTGKANEALKIRFGSDNTSVHESFLKSVYKKYRGLHKEIPQFDKVEIFKTTDVQPCKTCAPQNDVKPKPDTKFGQGGKIDEGGKIGNWDANKAVNWLACASTAKSQRLCAFAVQQAVIVGGVPCPTGSGYHKALNLLKTKNWDLVTSGKTSTAEISGIKPQVGDIMGMTRGDDFKYCGHVCMYCGSKYGWISDYKQYNKPYVYTKNGRPAGTYWMIRYKGGSKSIQQNPLYCNKVDGVTKCLNKPC